ncbi:TonB-dependent receptor domain-containing protein [Ideonella sp.]|uniref:TonB-dependent receptor domain-containing protein n=1 Tax=Ideonella sp. TaxID=1929293 RepID=UPI0035B1EB4E
MSSSFLRLHAAQAPARVCALALACVAACLPVSLAHAQAAPAAAVQPAAAPDPERIVITGTREPVAAGRLAGDLVVIDEEQIRASTADSVEDLLRREAGLQLSRNGGPGSSAGLFMRGAGVGNTLVLVDGVRIGSATLGQVEFEGLSLAMIERIEVLRGPGSSLYGADGAGGVIQIFTRRGDGSTRVGAALAAGQYGAAEGSVHASGRFGAVDAAASLSHERLDGVSAVRPGDQWGNHHPDRDGFERSTAHAQFGWRVAPGHRLGVSAVRSELDAQYDSSEYLPPDFAADASPDFRNRLDNQVLALEHRADWSSAWATTLRTSWQESDLTSGGTQTSRFRTRRQQVEAQATWKPAAGQRLTVAFDGLSEEADTPAYQKERDNQALVLAWLGELGGAGGRPGVQLQADLRHDDNSAYGDVTTGRLGAAYEFTKGWRVRALAGTSFRAPSFNETDYPGYGVPGLDPERGRSVELGLSGRVGGVELTATAWHNRMRDLIVYTPDPADCPDDPSYAFGCAANVSDAKLQGLTLGGSAELGAWSLRAQVDVVDAKDADTGARLNRRAAHQASFGADYTWGDWRFGAAVLQVGERSDSGWRLPQETTLDLKARWQLARDWALEAKVLNATDVDLTPARDYQGLGRQAWLGVRYDFGGR